jgi:UPF0755 protein
MIRVLVTLFIGCLLGLGGWALFGYQTIRQPTAFPEGGTTLRIEKGWSGARIALELQGAGIVPNALLFRMVNQFYRSEGLLKAGRYRFEGNLNTLEVREILLKGQVLTRQFVIAEGLNQWQIAEKLAQTFVEFDAAAFLEAFQDPKILSTLPKEALSIEGYLFPETYTVHEDATPLEIARIMVNECRKRLTPELLLRAQDLGLGEHQLMTLASIIEKETGDPSERGLISAVFHNRLRKKMRLQTDPTVIYGMWHTYDGNIRRKDLLTPTPYNTYVIPGLPPGPIASPGEDAIKKAAQPDPSTFLFFVSRGDGSGLHDFSNTLEEHNRAVSRFLRRYRQRIAQ